jgi:hemerythrin superfamily protein
MDVIGLLKKDHQEVSRLLQRAQADTGRRASSSVVERICDELDAHALVEEEIFYPAVRATGDDELERLVDESYEEHERVKQHIRMLRARDAGEAATARTLQTLAQDVEHHVTEEEGEMFPRVSDAIDARGLRDLGRQVQEHKQALAGGTPSRARRQPREKRAAGGRSGAGRTKRSTAARGRKAKPARKRPATRAKKRSAKTSRTKKQRARGGRRG